MLCGHTSLLTHYPAYICQLRQSTAVQYTHDVWLCTLVLQREPRQPEKIQLLFRAKADHWKTVLFYYYFNLFNDQLDQNSICLTVYNHSRHTQIVVNRGHKIWDHAVQETSRNRPKKRSLTAAAATAGGDLMMLVKVRIIYLASLSILAFLYPRLWVKGGGGRHSQSRPNDRNALTSGHKVVYRHR
jgi:hypothetical protein